MAAEPSERRPSLVPPMTRLTRVLAALLGAAAFGAGTAAVFVTENGPGSAVLLAFGGTLLVLALLGDTVESFELAGAKLRLRMVSEAAETYALAEESERRGDRDAAERLRREARALLEAAGPVADDYGSVRRRMRPGASRTIAMADVLDRARGLAREGSFDPVEVGRWLRTGSDEQRITALAMMQAREELRDPDAVILAIGDSRSAFEQYQSMNLTAMMIDDLDARQLKRLLIVVREQDFEQDSSRASLATTLLRGATARLDTRM